MEQASEDSSPPELTLHEITQYILSQPAYRSYSEQEKFRMVRRLGPSVVAHEIEITETE